MNRTSALQQPWISATARTPSLSGAHGLPVTGATKLVLGLVVAAVFFERIEMDGYADGSLPFPDALFLLATVLATLKLVIDSAFNCARPQPLTNRDGLLIGLVLLIGAISIAPAIQRDFAAQTIKTYVHLLGLLGCAFVIGRSLNQELVRYMLRVYLAGATLVSILAIVQTIDLNLVPLGVTEALGLKFRTAGDYVRPVSIYSEPAYLGYAGLIGMLIGIWDYQQTRSRLTGFAIGFCLCSMLLASAMGPIVIAVALGLFIVATGRIGRVSPGFVLAGGIAATLLILSPAGNTIYERAESIVYGGDASASSRSKLNSGSIDIWKLQPWTGVGLGNSRAYLSDFVHIPGVKTIQEFPAANVYLALLGEVGPLGVAALCFVLINLIRGERPWRDTTSTETLLRLLVLLTALQFFIIGNFLLPPFWFWAGLRLGAQHGLGKHGPTSDG